MDIDRELVVYKLFTILLVSVEIILQWNKTFPGS